MTLKTPIYNSKLFPDVYEPSEDSFLFIDALEAEICYLKNLKPQLITEIGSGSGVVITALSQIFGSSCFYLATDVNPQACLATKNTATLNNISLDSCNMDLLCGFRNTFDLILFNPPYVVTDPEETQGNSLNRAWAGGADGRVFIDKLITNLPKLLSDNSAFYCVLLKENKPNEVILMAENLGFSSELVIQRKIPGEHLYIYKFFR